MKNINSIKLLFSLVIIFFLTQILPPIMDGVEYNRLSELKLTYKRNWFDEPVLTLIETLGFIFFDESFYFSRAIILLLLTILASYCGRYGWLLLFSILSFSSIFNNVRQGLAVVLLSIAILQSGSRGFLVAALSPLSHKSAAACALIAGGLFVVRKNNNSVFLHIIGGLLVLNIIVFLIVQTDFIYGGYETQSYNEGRLNFFWRNIFAISALLATTLVYVIDRTYSSIEQSQRDDSGSNSHELIFMLIIIFGITGFIQGNIYSSSEVYSRVFAYANLLIPVYYLLILDKVRSPLIAFLFVAHSVFQNQWLIVANTAADVFWPG
jgi:hypothetical protein